MEYCVSSVAIFGETLSPDDQRQSLTSRMEGQWPSLDTSVLMWLSGSLSRRSNRESAGKSIASSGVGFIYAKEVRESRFPLPAIFVSVLLSCNDTESVVLST